MPENQYFYFSPTAFFSNVGVWVLIWCHFNIFFGNYHKKERKTGTRNTYSHLNFEKMCQINKAMPQNTKNIYEKANAENINYHYNF